jgi:hypothetical protein
MRKLITYTLYLIGITLVIMFVFEGVYQWSYANGTPRDKVQWLRSFDNNTHFDYVILGSSRSLNNINPIQIKEATGLNGVNLGSPANGPFEIRLMFVEFLKHSSTDAFYIQVDYRNDETPDPLGKIVWMPYITDDTIYESFENYGNSYRWYKYIPYYRFLKFDPKIGLRNVVLSLGGKGKTISEFAGYIPIDHEIEGAKTPNAQYPTMVNKHLVDIQERAQKEGIQVYFFTAPILNNPFDFTPFNNYLTNYKDLSNRIKNTSYFADNTHCNERGAIACTELFIKEYFRSEN